MRQKLRQITGDHALRRSVDVGLVDAEIVLAGHLVGMAHPLDDDVEREPGRHPIVFAVLPKRVTPLGVFRQACPLADHAEVSPDVLGHESVHEKRLALGRNSTRVAKNRQQFGCDRHHAPPLGLLRPDGQPIPLPVNVGPSKRERLALA
ncbi:MAG: hypothetical protein HS101_18250 [Planctomycetia bacterium]|nr:hypothetical protein [Planctomycetia bacterium]